MSFSPFDDTLTLNRGSRTIGSGSSFPYDHLRQGVEITNTKFLYNGVQPKLWAGADNFIDSAKYTNVVDHSVNLTTYGQALGFTDYDGHQKFDDLPKYNPVAYITMGNNYPSPVTLNDGLMQENECAIEPFTIPFRAKTNENVPYTHRVCAELEDGNNFSKKIKNSERIQQFINLQTPVSATFFSDMGQSYMGDIRIDSITESHFRLINPFDDSKEEAVVAELSTTDQDFINKLFNLNINNNEDIRPYKHKSATAGFVFADTGMGTDSITFGGTTRGV